MARLISEWSTANAKENPAKDISVPAQRTGDIVASKRAVTADTDLRLCRYFGLCDGWSLRGRAACDSAIAKDAKRVESSRIQRCSLLVALRIDEF